MRSSGIWVGPKPNDWYPQKRRKEDAQRKRCKFGSTYWSDTSISQEIPRMANIHWKLGDRHGRISLEGINPADTGIFTLLASRTV